MADTLDITAGAGTTIATDDVGGAHYQRIKLSDGTADATGVIAADIGVKANALRVAPANDITDATYIGDIKFGEAEPNSAAILADTTAILANTAAIETAVELLDNAIDGNYLNVNLNVAGTDIAAGEGAISAQTQRVTIATDDDGVAHLATIAGDTTSIDGNITACNTGAVVIASGTVTTVSTVTNLAQMAGTAISMNEGALDAGVQRVSLATDDDSVAHLATIAGDTTSLDGKVTACNTGAVVVASGAITETNSASLAVVGGGAEATALRVTLANDSTGVVTIDGTVTAELSGTDNAVLDAIAVDTGNIETAVQVMDDWDATHDSAASADGPQLMGVYDSTKPTAVGDGDAVRVLTDAYGRLLAGVEPTRFQAVYNSADASGEGEAVHASAASTVIVVQSYVISVDAEMWVELQDEDSAAATGKFWLKAGGGVAITLPDKAPIVLGVDKDLEVITEGAGNISVSVTGYTIPG